MLRFSALCGQNEQKLGELLTWPKVISLPKVMPNLSTESWETQHLKGKKCQPQFKGRTLFMILQQWLLFSYEKPPTWLKGSSPSLSSLLLLTSTLFSPAMTPCSSFMCLTNRMVCICGAVNSHNLHSFTLTCSSLISMGDRMTNSTLSLHNM